MEGGHSLSTNPHHWGDSGRGEQNAVRQRGPSSESHHRLPSSARRTTVTFS